MPGEHGHEASGIVVEAGMDVRGVKAGDIVCRLNLARSHDLEMKCFAEYAVADAPIRVNGGDPEVVCFADPVALNHIHHAHVSSGDTVWLVGQGFIGLLVAQLLRDQHINVIATDIKDRRLALARAFGAQAVDAREPDCEKKIRALDGDIRAVIECSVCIRSWRWRAGFLVREAIW